MLRGCSHCAFSTEIGIDVAIGRRVTIGGVGAMPVNAVIGESILCAKNDTLFNIDRKTGNILVHLPRSICNSEKIDRNTWSISLHNLSSAPLP